MKKMNDKTRKRAGIATGAIAVILMAIGIAGGEPADVLHKAVEICLQCIGIG